MAPYSHQSPQTPMFRNLPHHIFRRTRISFGGIMTSLSVVLLYATIFKIGRYPVTIGGLFCVFAILFSLRSLGAQRIPLLIGAAMIVWPCVIVAISSLIEAELTPDLERFVMSFSLWIVSIAIITLGAITRKPIQLGNVTVALAIISALTLWQGVGARLFGTASGYSFVAPLFAFDIFDSYLGLNNLSTARAIGSYYEPSMCARVVGTLCFIDVLLNRRVFRNAVILTLTLLLTQSLSLIVLMSTLGIILLGRFSRELLGLMLAGILLSMFSAPFVAKRLAASEGSTTSSVYVRTEAPLDTIGWLLQNYPLGMPIGAAEALAERTGYVRQTKELKITNGVYEFVTYFGVLGIIAIAAGIMYILFSLASGERERAAAVTYLILSTALSGSFLSIESSYLTYLFIVAARVARSSRLEFGRRQERRFATVARDPRVSC